MFLQVAPVGHDVPMALPKKRQIADALRDEIARGVYGTRGKLPSERDLTIRFEASRNTVRDALQLLMNEGLITSEHGRGYIVTSHEVFTLDASRHENLQFSRPEDGDSYSNEVLHAGRVPDQKFRVEIESAPAEIADRLRIPTGSTTVYRHCLRFVDHVPWSTQATHYPMWVAEGTRLTEPGDIAEGTTRYLADQGLEQVGYHDEFSTRMPTPAESIELQIGPGVPVLVWIRTGYTTDRPIRVTTTTFRGDLNRITYDLGDLQALYGEEGPQ